MNDTIAGYSGRENLEAMRHARNYNRYLLRVLDRYATGRTVLDFGAGAGTFAIPLMRADRHIVCVEPDAELRAVLAAAGLQVCADLDGVPAQSVDAAYSLNVLEHVADDQTMLAAIARRVKPSGRFVLYVPAFQLLFTSMDTRVGHFRRYRKEPLRQQLERAGFTVEVARYVDSVGFFVTLLYKLIGSRSGVIGPASVVLYDRVLFPVSRLADHVLNRLFGKNLLVVARKP